MLLKRTRLFLKYWNLSISLAKGSILSLVSVAIFSLAFCFTETSLAQMEMQLSHIENVKCEELFTSARFKKIDKSNGRKSRSAEPLVNVFSAESFIGEGGNSFFQKKPLILGGVSISIAAQFRELVFTRMQHLYKDSTSVTVISDIGFAYEWLRFLEEAYPQQKVELIYPEDTDVEKIAKAFRKKRIQHLIVMDLSQSQFYADQASVWVDFDPYRSTNSIDVYKNILKKDHDNFKSVAIYLLKEIFKDASAWPLAYTKAKFHKPIKMDPPEKKMDLAKVMSDYIIHHKDDPRGHILPTRMIDVSLIQWMLRQKKIYHGEWWTRLTQEAIDVLKEFEYPQTAAEAEEVFIRKQSSNYLVSHLDDADFAQPSVDKKIPIQIMRWLKVQKSLDPFHWWKLLTEEAKQSLENQGLLLLLKNKFNEFKELPRSKKQKIVQEFSSFSIRTFIRYGQLYRYILEHKDEKFDRRVLPPQSDPTGLGKWLNNLKLRSPQDWWQPLPADAQQILQQRNLQGLLLRSDEQWLEYYQKAFFNRDPKKKYIGVFSFFPKDEPNLKALQGWLTRLQRRDPLNWWRPFHPEVQEFLRQRRVLIDNDLEFDDESILLEEDI